MILLWLEDDQVEFRKEEKYQDDVSTRIGRHTQREHLHFDGEIDGGEGQPDDTRRVHGEADEFRLCKQRSTIVHLRLRSVNLPLKFSGRFLVLI